jgi:hypothetical protein
MRTTNTISQAETKYSDSQKRTGVVDVETRKAVEASEEDDANNACA